MNIEQIAQSNIFFIVTTISVVVLSLLLAFVLVQLIRILRNVREVSETIKVEGKNIITDISSLRNNLKEKGRSMSQMASFVGMAQKFKKKATKKKP